VSPVVLAVIIVLALAAGVGGVALRGLPRRRRHQRVDDGDGPFQFPAGFLWGTATSDQQIEHQQPSDWTELELRAKAGDARVRINGIADVAPEILQKKCDFDRLYAEDLKRASALGQNAHRFSLSWARLFPKEEMHEPDPAGIDFYRRVVDECIACGLVPFVTLHHFAIPTWLTQEVRGKRGVERDDAPLHFEYYARAVAAALGDKVRFWCTINEPMVYAYQGYLDGSFPPNEKRSGPAAVVPVVAGLLRMHAGAYSALHEDAERRGQQVSVGIAQHVRAFMPWRDHSPIDRVAARFADRAFVLEFLDALDTGKLGPLELPECAATMDYVGVNYYGRSYVKTNPFSAAKLDVLFHDENEPGDEASDLGWAADEGGFTDSLVRFHERYHRPIYVLENGIADKHDDDVRRQRFLVRHAQAMWRAIERGVDLRGYFHWSLIDNFEWAEGFGPRFGLHHVDYAANFKRTARPSAGVYQSIASSNEVSSELWRRYRR
jgi:beta-glucosidase